MRTPSMAGTRRAYDTCAGCGHARVRHLAYNGTRCGGVIYGRTWNSELERFLDIPQPCACTAFEAKDT